MNRRSDRVTAQCLLLSRSLSLLRTLCFSLANSLFLSCELSLSLCELSVASVTAKLLQLALLTYWVKY